MKRIILPVIFFVMTFANAYAKNNNNVIEEDFCAEQWLEEVATQPMIFVMDDCQCPNEYLPELVNKALKNAQEGSVIAVDKIEINLTDGWCGSCKWSREDCEDHVIEILLDKGYKVVSKENIEKLREDNPTFVGYYLNVKVTDEKMRVQLIDAVTGDYIGNAIVY